MTQQSTTSSIIGKSAKELQKLLKNRTLTCKAVLDQVYEQIQAHDPKINAFLHLSKEEAYQQAEEIDKKFDKGDNLPALAGIPISIKDNMNIKNQPTTCASKILENYIAPYNATIIENIKKQGMIPVGKVNMDEFAMGSSTENSAKGATKNPWDITRAPGGSSGGSAASVAANMVPLSLGSDTGGSIRQPAAFCGIVGMKPTYGRVSRYGLIAFASSLDQIGPFSRTVEDSALLLNSLCGHDPLDATTAQLPVPDFTKSLTPDIGKLKIAVPKEIFSEEGIDPAIKQATAQALDTLKTHGIHWDEISMSSLKYGLSTYYIIAPAEASANLARFDGVRYGYRQPDTKDLREMYKQTRGNGFGSEVKRRIILGTYALSAGYYDAYYLKAQKVRTAIKEEFNRVFEKYDLVVSPTTPTPSFKLGENTEDPLSMYMSDIATIPANLAGLPAISIPCGFSNNLPIGLQMIGRPFEEETILKTAYTYQTLTDHHLQHPNLGDAS